LKPNQAAEALEKRLQKVREDARTTTALLENARSKKKVTRLSTADPLVHETISRMLHAWFSKDKTDRTTYGAKAIFLQPYVEDGIAGKTLARYLEENPTKRRKLNPPGQSLKGRPRTLTESEMAVVIDVVQKTDEQNNGMTNRELVTIISDMRPSTIPTAPPPTPNSYSYSIPTHPL
jgi:hypothetical protein